MIISYGNSLPKKKKVTCPLLSFLPVLISFTCVLLSCLPLCIESLCSMVSVSGRLCLFRLIPVFLFVIFLSFGYLFVWTFKLL